MKAFKLICSTAVLALLTNTNLLQADLDLTPGLVGHSGAGWSVVQTGTQTSQSQINTAIAGTLGTSTEMYKQNVGGPEVGPLAADYVTTFFNSPLDPADAKISLASGGTPYTGATHFLVKDGNQNPAWYLFAITWDGVMDINAIGFWPQQGAISHVTIYGGPGDPNITIPEPTSMILAGLGICGLPLIARRRRNAA